MFYRTALVHETTPLVLALSHFVYGLSPRCHRKSPVVRGTCGDRKFKRVTKRDLKKNIFFEQKTFILMYLRI